MTRCADVARTLLWAAVEDYAGLWELVWELNAAGLGAEGDRRELARSAVTDMMGHGWVLLYQCREPYGEMTPMETAAASAAVDADTSWVEPTSDSISYRVSATTRGQQAYEELAVSGSGTASPGDES